MGDVKGRELVFRADSRNEQIVLAAAMAGGTRAEEFRKAAVRHPPDAFLTPEHATIWKAVREAENRRLPPDPATLARLSGGEVDLLYLTELMAARPDVPDDATLAFVLEQLAWDRQKHVAVTGPIDQLLQAIQKNEGPERVRGLSRAVSACFDGWGDRRFLHDPAELAREQIADVRRRQKGLASYPFGLDGLDYYEAVAGQEPKRRVVVGAAPGLVTIIAGWSGSGKSTLAARLALGMARAGRKVLYGAWEMRGGMTLELLACMSLNWSRSKLYTPGAMTDEEMAVLEARMALIGTGGDKVGWVRFMGNPFGRTAAAKESNERNLDVVQGYIADSGCDVFFADLWERCLVRDEPQEEKRALFRQQAMFEEMNVHGVLLAQLSKAQEGQRPTMAGIKGSGGWYEIGDNILGIHRAYLFKPVPDTCVEISILKQRQGVAPLAVELDWDADRGMISGGRSIEYERPGFQQGVSSNPIDQKLRDPKPKQGRR
jgi:hypothetical protein